MRVSDLALPPQARGPKVPTWVHELARGVLPPALGWLGRRPDARAWLEELPSTIRATTAMWDITVGQPMVGGVTSVVAAATMTDGSPAVLKIQLPHRESEQEADALRAWDGAGAVHLLAHDARRGALLLERCMPGTPLGEAKLSADAGLDILVALLPRLWLPARPTFETLEDEAAHWVAGLEEAWERAGRPWERRLLEEARDALWTLGPTQGEQVLVNQDLHGGNVLRATREPWLVIDPKPLLGEREFALAPIVRSFELGHSRQAVFHRLDRLSDDLGLDRERVRLWTIGQTIAWS
ncbi:MAG: aminoglycoside phosphotransferase family protein, partial [Candidatus Limnocylindrales bacterium]